MKPRTLTNGAPTWRLLLAVIVTLGVLLSLTGVAAADDETTTTVPAEEATVDEAPALDYTFTWPTFIVTFALVIGYYIFVFRMSEKEFKGVVAERFGMKSTEREEAAP